MKQRMSSEFIFQLFALLIAVIVVHAAYVGVIRPSADAQLARNAELQAQLADLVARKVNTGIARKLEQRRAEAEAAATAALLPTLEALVRDSIYTLALLTGKPPETWLARLETPKPPPLLH